MQFRRSRIHGGSRHLPAVRGIVGEFRTMRLADNLPHMVTVAPRYQFSLPHWLSHRRRASFWRWIARLRLRVIPVQTADGDSQPCTVADGDVFIVTGEPCDLAVLWQSAADCRSPLYGRMTHDVLTRVSRASGDGEEKATVSRASRKSRYRSPTAVELQAQNDSLARRAHDRIADELGHAMTLDPSIVGVRIAHRLRATI